MKFAHAYYFLSASQRTAENEWGRSWTAWRKRQAGGESRGKKVRTLARSDWSDSVFAYYDRDELGPAALEKFGRKTVLPLEDL